MSTLIENVREFYGLTCEKHAEKLFLLTAIDEKMITLVIHSPMGFLCCYYFLPPGLVIQVSVLTSNNKISDDVNC